MFSRSIWIAMFSLLLFSGITDARAWMSYEPVLFVGDMTEIYSKMPTFHGYTTEFLNNSQVKQVCVDSGHDGVILDYCDLAGIK